MNPYRYNTAKEDKQGTNIWDAFVDHVETIYFPGATDLLDKQTLTFAFNHFKKEQESII